MREWGKMGEEREGKKPERMGEQTVERGEREELDRGLSRVPAGSIYRGKE